MQNYTTIIGVIKLCQCGCFYEVIQKRYSIGSCTLQFIMKRFGKIDIQLHDLKGMELSEVEEMLYSLQSLRKEDVPMLDY